MSEVWVPAPLRARHVLAGDVFVSPQGDLWMVTERGDAILQVQCGVERVSADLDPDDIVNVLVPTTEKEAVELTMDELGARLIGRET